MSNWPMPSQIEPSENGDRGTYGEPCYRHKFTLPKRWVIDGIWYAIQRCRRCDVWKRVAIRIDAAASRLNPLKQTQVIEEYHFEINDLNPPNLPERPTNNET